MTVAARALAGLLLVAAAPLAAAPGHGSGCWHPSPHAHAYGAGGPVSPWRRWAYASTETGSGGILVWDGNLADCDGDGLPAEFDGDYESGLGGAFFGYGPWADEPVCDHGLATHGATVTIQDVAWGPSVWFVFGADDTAGPVISTDPVTGETTCETDGRITPGDPATDPTADPDDCLSGFHQGSGTNPCGAGGDGGYWVFACGSFLGIDGEGNVVLSNGTMAGTLTA